MVCSPNRIHDDSSRLSRDHIYCSRFIPELSEQLGGHSVEGLMGMSLGEIVGGRIENPSPSDIVNAVGHSDDYLLKRYITHIGNESYIDDDGNMKFTDRQSLAENYRRHRELGIQGHEDALGEATVCPGVRFYRWCRDSIVNEAISRAT